MHVSKISPQLRIGGILVYLFLYIPLFVLVIYSFNDSRVNVGWVGFTLKWYKVLFHDRQLIDAAVNSIIKYRVGNSWNDCWGSITPL